MNIKIYINCIKNGCWKLLWKDIKYDWRWRNHRKNENWEKYLRRKSVNGKVDLGVAIKGGLLSVFQKYEAMEKITNKNVDKVFSEAELRFKIVEKKHIRRRRIEDIEMFGACGNDAMRISELNGEIKNLEKKF